MKLISIFSVMRMAQYGLLDLWKEKHFLKSKCEDEDGKRYNSGPILFSHIWLLLAVTAGCLGICIAILCLELTVSVIKYKNYTNKSKGFVH